MKKIIFPILILTIFIITTGCNNKLECSLTNDKFTLVFENGKIIKYLDKSGKEEDYSKIEEFNTYLVDAKNNTDAMSTIKALLVSFGGNCN